jgi:predicted ribosome quality control (RQC) complex YloA/Tae2 family protein
VSVLLDWQKLLTEENYKFVMASDSSGKPRDYSYMDMTYTGDGFEYRTFDSACELFDCYFAERDRLEKIHQRAHDIKNLLSAAKARTEKKLNIQREALADSAKGEEYKRYGDLITANIYKLKRGDRELVTVDYYTEDCPTVSIPLDERLTPAANAQRMYKLYNKCKNAKAVLTEQISLWEKELTYLESVSAFLERAECEADIVDIRDELYNAGYASRLKGYNPKKTVKTKPHVFKTQGGFTVLVGKNNLQNDRITKESGKDDLWFHVKDAPGSHVILITDGKEPSDGDYTEAAEYAAAYSSQNSSDVVAVDYTRVKNIKKPAGSKPGFVTYKTNYTAYVRPKKNGV